MSQQVDMLQSLLFNQCFINNQWVSAEDTFEVLNPANQEIITTVANANTSLANQAVESAAKAFLHWQNTTAQERCAILKKWHTLIIEHTENLANLLTTEQGKPLAEAKAEIIYGASFIEWFAEECKRTNGETIPTPHSNKRLFTIKQPIGVVAAITPWNFPVAMITRKIAPALAAGCTVVLKPAEDTPLCALALAYLAKEAGLPSGVLNVIPTTNVADVGAILTTHATIKKLSFTGSTATGKLLMQQCATTVKKLSLELGGNAPCIVFDSANIDVAVKGVLASKYRNGGQTCICANRILVQKNIYPRFLQAYTAAVKQLKTGNGFAEENNIGPLINKKAVQKVEYLLQDAVEKGATIVCGGKRHDAGELFFEPTILINCSTHMQLSQEEIFGPLSAIYVFDTEEEAITIANSTAYGLAAYFFTSNISQVYQVAEQLHCGIIGINEGIVSYAQAPFGGFNESGFGKEGSHYGIEEYLHTKYICIGLEH